MAEVDINQSYRWLGGIFRQVFSLQGDISPAQITADQDDYNPTGLSTAAILRLSTDATRNINGISGGADGRIIKIVNVGTQGIVLKDEATTSTAANRFALNTDLTISENQAVELLYDATTSRWRAIGGTGGSVVLPPSEQNGVVSGGTVTWLQNYDYEVSESFYYINNILYHSAATTVTLAAADPTDDRIDLFVLTTSNTADKVTGTASTPPAEPNYDPATQLKISFAFVENGTTQPTITQDWLYRENAGTPAEWAYTDNTANLNPASTNNPFAGTLDIEGTTVGSGNSFTLTDTASPNFGLYDALVFKIRSKASWTTNIGIRWFNGTTALGNNVLFGHGSYGFNSSNVTTYQNINIPLSSFGLITGADRITFQRMVGGGTIGFYIDDIQLMNTGAAGPATLVPISSLLNAVGANTISNGDLVQNWQWNTLSGSGLKLSSTSTAAAGSTQKLFESVLSGANANSGQNTYCVHASNTHTGSGSINYRLFGIASGGSSNYGVRGQTSAAAGAGIGGLSTGAASGVEGSNNSSGAAVFATHSGTGTANLISHTGTTGTKRAVWATNTGAATTNIGAQFEASGATNNRAIIVPTAKGNIGFGTETPSAQALLELASTSQAFIVMRMTAAQASAITPAAGMMLFVTDTDGTFTSVGFWGYDGSAWNKF